MKSSSWWTPTTKVAVALVVLAAGGIVAYCLCWLQAWMPNVVVGAITVALTITIIERAVRREAQQRLQPRVNDVLRAMGQDFLSLAGGIAFDYAEQPGDSFRPIPADAVGIVNLWLSHSSRTPDPERDSSLLRDGQEFADRLERHRKRDHDVIPMDLMRAIDKFQSAIRGAKTLARFYPGSEIDPAVTRRLGNVQVVRGASEWLKAFEDQASVPLVLSDSLREIAERCSKDVINRREDGTADDVQDGSET